MNEELEIFNELEENIFSLAKKIEYLDENEKQFEINKINNLFQKIDNADLIQDLKEQFQKILTNNNISNDKISSKIKIKDESFENDSENNNVDEVENISKNIKKKNLKQNIQKTIEIDEKQYEKEKEYFNSLKSKNYVIEFVGKKFNAKYESEELILLNKDGLISIPYDNILNYYSYFNGKVSAIFEKVFLLILFLGSLYYFPGLYKFVLGGIFGFLFIYPFLISKKLLFIKLKMDSEPDDKEHYRPIIKTYKLFYNDVKFVEELKKHVKFYHKITRLVG